MDVPPFEHTKRNIWVGGPHSLKNEGEVMFDSNGSKVREMGEWFDPVWVIKDRLQ